ncbi:MAG: SpoIIE family protein phosphatase [Symploca sp. SIO2B6]|nr:SpoIIE family protein phosphatase [Symploca sp. SIO2B6]
MTTTHTLLPPSILLVDDDKVTRLIMKSLLVKHGYHVTDVDTGEECLDVFQASRPDMILLDAKMPGIDGFTCCSKIKHMPGGDRTPIMMITGLNDSNSVDQAFDAGAIDYVTKPIHPAVLTRRLRRILEGEQAKQTLEKQHQLLQEELTEASEYVCNLLPKPLSAPVMVNCMFEPSLDLGGDAFDYYWIDDHHLVMYLVDVAGHGAKSALLSVSVLNILRSQALVGADLYQPSTVLAKLNEIFEMSDNGGNYFTIWYGVYNRETRKLIYSSGGHPPAVLIFNSNTIPTAKRLDSDGIPIGMMPDWEFEDEFCTIAENDHLYIFSDGVYEIENDNGHLWGFDAFVEVLKTNRNQQMSNALESVFKEAKQFSGCDTLNDDFSIIEMKF